MGEIEKIDAALDIIKDSEKLIIGLRFSINRASAQDLQIRGLSSYLKATKRTMQQRLLWFAFRAICSWIGRKIRSLLPVA